MRPYAFLLLCALAVGALTPKALASTKDSDPQGVMLAQKALFALAGGTPVSDVTLKGTVTRTAGSDNQVASASFVARGTNQSRVDLSTTPRVLEIRNDPALSDSYWYDAAGKAHPTATHNCWTDAAWFYPALSSLAAVNDPSTVVAYVGEESLAGQSVQHIKFSRSSKSPLVSHLSAVDVFLDSLTLLPIAETFSVHPDDDAGIDLPVQVLFSDYRNINGFRVPFRVQRYIQGSLMLDLVVTSATVNAGVSDSAFAN